MLELLLDVVGHDDAVHVLRISLPLFTVCKAEANALAFAVTVLQSLRLIWPQIAPPQAHVSHVDRQHMQILVKPLGLLVPLDEEVHELGACGLQCGSVVCPSLCSVGPTRPSTTSKQPSTLHTCQLPPCHYGLPAGT